MVKKAIDNLIIQKVNNLLIPNISEKLWMKRNTKLKARLKTTTHEKDFSD